jgi:deoxyribodipyrimidine photo-lyase
LTITSTTTVVWLRNDLRLADNPALAAACRHGDPIVIVYVWADDVPARWAPGAAARWWLWQSVTALAADLRRQGSDLHIRRGRAADVLPRLAREVHAGAVYWNRALTPGQASEDDRLAQVLRRGNVKAKQCTANVLVDPEAILNRSGRPYAVFTPFWHALMERALPLPQPAPTRIPATGPLLNDTATTNLADQAARDWSHGFADQAARDWSHGFAAAWQPGEAGARRLLARVPDLLPTYARDRDRVDRTATSRLSPHLHYGELSPRQLWHTVRDLADHDPNGALTGGAEALLRQLAWREFAHHLLHHHPETSEQPLRSTFDRFTWRDDPEALRAWQQGQTGYPLVDAGMRQLWQTGWMHNRARLVCASFLTKDLLLPWQAGARWFWDTLLDADLANNSFGWQWVAGCGADAAPYYRIFNPVLQGRRFDPQGSYVRRWVPELQSLPDAWIQAPWEAPSEVLAAAEISLGETYPLPIIAHDVARRRALGAYANLHDTAIT